MGALDRHTPALTAVRRLLGEHGLPVDRLEAWKDGSNLLVRPVPAPVILRVATFTGRVRRDPMPYLEREVALVSWLHARGAPVMAPATVMPAGPFLVDGFGVAAWAFVEHLPGVVPGPAETLAALRELHDAMRGYPGPLPLLGPVTDDLDRALAFAVSEAILATGAAEELRRRRHALVPALLAADPALVPQHGDAFPRNAVVALDGRVTWIDLEDACLGSRAWDLAVLARNTDDPEVRAAAIAAVGSTALATAMELRAIQAETWSALHDARVARGW
jgi:Ser/Thr protein kinase RdoA (MazF antagonist)